MNVYIFISIVAATFLLEDPTTLSVGSLIASHQISFLFGFTSLVVGIFLGDLGLYGMGYLFKKGLVSTTKKFINPSTGQIILARFIPGMRTLTFLASGFEGYPFRKFILLIFPSSLIWTLLLLIFTEKAFNIIQYFPVWFNFFLGLLFMLALTKYKIVMKFLSSFLLISVMIFHHLILIRKNAQKKRSLSFSRYSQLLLKILDIEIKSELMTQGQEEDLVIFQPQGVVDILCLSSLYPNAWVALSKVEKIIFCRFNLELCGINYFDPDDSVNNFSMLQKDCLLLVVERSEEKVKPSHHLLKILCASNLKFVIKPLGMTKLKDLLQ